MTTGAEPEFDAKFAALVLGSRDAIVEQTLQGDILSWNPGAERLYGYRACDVVGRNISLVIPPGRKRFEAAFARKARVGKQVNAVETTRVNRSGEELRVTVSKSPGASNNTFVDVSSLSTDEEVRRQSDASFKALLNAAPDAMVCVNSRGTITLVNDEVRNLFQYSAAELVGHPVELLLPAHLAAGHIAKRSGFLADPQRRPMGAGLQLTARRRDGSTFAADISLASLDTEAGIVVTAAIRDVSERQAVDAALRESESRFQQLASSVSAAFTLRSLDPPALLYASPGFMQVFGYDIVVEEHSELDVLGHVFNEDHDRIGDLSDHLLDSGGRLEADYRVVRPSGEIRWVHTAKAPVLDDDGRFTRIASWSEDITERKLVEEELRRAHREAERANAAKDQFLSRMSHELRTPLNSVLGFGQLLELDRLTQPQHEAVNHILRAGRHLLSMIDDVLDIAQADGEELNDAPKPIQVARAITDAIDLLRPTADASSIDLRYGSMQEDVDHYVRADARRLSQVLLNLLSNAIKYNPHGGHVDVHCSVVDQNVLHVAIIDTGVGIRTRDFGRLFEPFDRIGAEALHVEGTGIGLAVTQRLVHAMGAQLRVESTVGVGSIFTIVIPLTEPTEIADALSRAEHMVPPGGLEKHRRDTFTLVYIEDDTANANLMRRILALRPAWRMMHAETGRSGIEVVRRTAPTLIFLDLHLPDMSGAQVLKELRASDDTKDVPIIIVTADASTAQMAHLRGLGASVYLTEPLDVVDILQLLDHFDPAASPMA